jgi:hypothetical protein
MATTIDHLSINHMVRVVQDFTDAQGTTHRVGEQGLIVALGYNSLTGEVSITWMRNDERETMTFARTSTSGPGNGRMKQYFDVGEYVAAEIAGQRLVPSVGYVPNMVALPDVRDEVIRTDARFDDAIERVWALAGRGRFDEAQEQLLAIVDAPDRRGENTNLAAEAMCSYARLHGFDTDLTVYRWLKDRGIGLWYAWGAGATSGGEGTYRATYIRAAERAFDELERNVPR